MRRRPRDDAERRALNAHIAMQFEALATIHPDDAERAADEICALAALLSDWPDDHHPDQ